MKLIAFITMSFCLLAGYSFAGGEADLNQLSAECVQAAKKFRPIQMEGNINLFSKNNEFVNYTFQGIIKNGTIMGLWKNAELNKAFTFYVYPKNQGDNQK